jgi:shikimate dehydrogenase
VIPSRLVLLGQPVSHSLSPVFQAAALSVAGIDVSYEAVEVREVDLPAMLKSLVRDRAAGNVTLPHKERVAALCEVRTPLAAKLQAVNTFWTDNAGRLVGDNTDVGGFTAAATRLLDRVPQGLRVAVLGAGGAAVAVCEAIAGWPESTVVLHARTRERAEALAARYADRASVAASEMQALDGADLLVNATPLGLEGSLMPVAPGMIPKSVAVMDLTYRRGRTPWVSACRSRGLRAEDGLPMLIVQGALAFERWFGVPPDREAMWASVRS